MAREVRGAALWRRELVDRDISATCVMAYGLWAMSVALWAVAWALHMSELGQLALIVCGGACTLTVRSYVVTLTQRMRTVMAVVKTVDPDRGRPFG